MFADLQNRLAAKLGPKGIVTEAGRIAPHLDEWRGRYHGATPFMAMPANVEEVSLIVKECAQAGAAVTPQGGNTGLVGGQIPQGEVLLNLSRMNAIRAVDPIDDSITVEAGCVLTRVQEAAAEAQRRFPLSLASQGSATIGGLISTNAGGVHVLRYGMMRDLVLGVEAVLPNGEIFHGIKTLRKDNTGYDLKQLFIGAEGTLGVITAASLKLFPKTAGRITALCALPSAEHAITVMHDVKRLSGTLAAFEIMNRESIAMTVRNVPGRRDPFPDAPYVALIECEAMFKIGLHTMMEAVLDTSLASGHILDGVIAQSEREVQEFWALREDMSAGHKPEGAQLSSDISVPVSAVPVFLREAEIAVRAILPSARIVAFGHAGDGNMHYTVVEARKGGGEEFRREAINAAVHETAVRLGGSISAEHGIGVTRLADFNRYKDPQAVAMMRAIKTALDPRNVMNPRVLLGQL